MESAPSDSALLRWRPIACLEGGSMTPDGSTSLARDGADGFVGRYPDIRARLAATVVARS
jgi:hypothetical protein